MWIIYLFGILVIFVGVILLFFFGTRRKLLASQKNRFLKQLGVISKGQSMKEKIIDYDVLYHHILKALGYEGTFGEILKKCPKEIGDIQRVWDLHKLRNSLVHDIKNNSHHILEQKSKIYEQEINTLLRRVS